MKLKEESFFLNVKGMFEKRIKEYNIV